MRKRRSTAPDDGLRKRPRVVHEAPTFEAIHSSRQLMQLLAFDQDIQKSRHGLQSFKLLLDKISDPEQRTTEDVAILHDYLAAIRPPTDERRPAKGGEDNDDDDEGPTDTVYFVDILQSWALAARVDNDGVRSAVPVVLALLLRYLSHVLELAPVGLGLCRTLLQPAQLALVARNLTADKGKEFVISPTLRLLREVVAFDGGAVARALFRARASTCCALARNMGIRFLGDGVEDARHTSARTNAVRFWLAALRVLHPEAKAELLAQRDVLGALTRWIRDDPPALVHELLAGLERDVLRDRKLPRAAKGRLLGAATLVQLGGLYSYAHEAAAAAGGGGGDVPSSVSDAAHRFLLYACTTLSAGVLRDQDGFYPKGVEPSPAASATAAADLVWTDRFAHEVPIHNVALGELLASLRPWHSTRQSALLVAVFAAAPELVAWYFVAKKSFTFEPKLSATWVGFAALLFRTIRLPLPPHFGCRPASGQGRYARLPPPPAIVVDAILPRPLSQKILQRCLSHRSKLAPFFALRLLAAALAKLRAALALHDEAAQQWSGTDSAALWTAAARRVVDEFCRRCPPMKDLVAAYRAAAPDDLLCREVASRALRLCYEVIPQVALLARFDVSPVLCATLQALQASVGTGTDTDHDQNQDQDKALRMMELEHLLALSGYSPTMRWFAKADGLATSPFVALVRLYSEAPADLVLGRVRSILEFVAREQEIVVVGVEPSTSSSASGLAALFHALSPASASASLWPFVDNCAVRCAMAPIRYMDMLQDLVGDDPVDPLTMTLVEQLPFATAPAEADALDSLAGFVARYFAVCSGSRRALQPLFQQAAAAFPAGSRAAEKLAAMPKRARKDKTSKEADKEAADVPMADAADILDDAPALSPALEDLLDLPPVAPLDHAALSKWATRPADELVEEGHAAALVMLLVSEHASIRREALVNVAKMAARVRTSTYADKDQVWLLLSELGATASAWMDDPATAALPLPSHLAVFAAHALDVLRRPLHRLYGKINAFLTAAPVWRPRRLPLVDAVLRDGPEQDDTHYAELHWLLDYLLASLRTPADVDVVRGARLWERLLSAAANPYLRAPLRRQVLRILARAATLDGGATTLVTRAGLVSWLAAYHARPLAADRNERSEAPDPGEARAITALLHRVWDVCDQARVDSWSMHGVAETVALCT